jgi:anti-sigma factor RsiW
MNALAPYLAAIHQQNLLEQAELDRLVRQLRQSRSADAGVPAWRRGLGAGARRLSALLAGAARSLDPSVDAEHTSARPAERPVGRVLAC